MLMPCLMKENNRAKNKQCIRYAKQNYPVDAIVINAQGFQDSDYEEGVLHIGFHGEGIGFAKARNELLKWFYESDYDWAIWLDANAKVSKPSLNDFCTLIDYAKANALPVAVIFATLGLQISGQRIDAKKMPDHFDKVRLVNFQGGYDWLHGMMFRNFRKVYGITPYIDERCNPAVGTSEDIFFARLCKKLFDCRLCPTVVISKPLNKYSTWVADQHGYKYAPVALEQVDRMVEQYCTKASFTPFDKTHCTLTLNRVESNRQHITPYKSRTKQKKGLLK